VPQVNLHSAAAISGSTVLWAAPTTECCAVKVKSWYKPQKLTLNSNSAERVANYLYLCYTDPPELSPRLLTQDTTEANYFRPSIWDDINQSSAFVSGQTVTKTH